MVNTMLTSQNGHFYVCGDYRMAEDVTSALKIAFQRAGGLSFRDSETLLAKLKVYNIIVNSFIQIVIVLCTFVRFFYV